MVYRGNNRRPRARLIEDLVENGHNSHLLISTAQDRYIFLNKMGVTNRSVDEIFLRRAYSGALANAVKNDNTATIPQEEVVIADIGNEIVNESPNTEYIRFRFEAVDPMKTGITNMDSVVGQCQFSLDKQLVMQSLPTRYPHKDAVKATMQHASGFVYPQYPNNHYQTDFIVDHMVVCCPDVLRVDYDDITVTPKYEPSNTQFTCEYQGRLHEVVFTIVYFKCVSIPHFTQSIVKLLQQNELQQVEQHCDSGDNNDQLSSQHDAEHETVEDADSTDNADNAGEDSMSLANKANVYPERQCKLPKCLSVSSGVEISDSVMDFFAQLPPEGDNQAVDSQAQPKHFTIQSQPSIQLSEPPPPGSITQSNPIQVPQDSTSRPTPLPALHPTYLSLPACSTWQPLSYDLYNDVNIANTVNIANAANTGNAAKRRCVEGYNGHQVAYPTAPYFSNYQPNGPWGLGQPGIHGNEPVCMFQGGQPATTTAAMYSTAGQINISQGVPSVQHLQPASQQGWAGFEQTKNNDHINGFVSKGLYLGPQHG